MEGLTVAGFTSDETFTSGATLLSTGVADLFTDALTICAEDVFVRSRGHATVTCDPPLLVNTVIVYAQSGERLILTEVHVFSETDTSTTRMFFYRNLPN